MELTYNGRFFFCIFSEKRYITKGNEAKHER